MKRRYFDLPVGLTDQRLGISPPNHHNTQYTYDKNGNLTKDLNKNISSIQYNFLNLPANITYSSGKSATYIYDANGQKLRTSYKASASATAVPTDYCGNMIYENGVLKQVLVDGGYMTVTGTPFYFYYLKDHLGSNRVVVSPAGTATQINHYYPFGGLFGESTGNTGQRYKYNGKEFDRTHGVDWYDYGARHMTPDAGRFTTIDPMAEKYYNISPYAYCANNPINAIDIKGDSTAVLSISSQHIALLIQNESGFWQYYSVNGNNVYLSGSFTGGRNYNDIGVGNFKSPQDFLNSEYNQKKEEDDPSTANYNYEKAYIIPTNKEQDSAIRNEFKRIASEEEYSLNIFAPNHCGTAVQKSLKAGGINVDEKRTTLSGASFYYVRPYLPSAAYKSIMSNNPRGYEVFKSR